MAGSGGNKKRFQYCTDPSGQEILYFRALQGHSGRNPIDPSLQDNVLIPDNFFEYICHIGCAINLHSIMHSGLIPGGQILSKRQTVFFLLVNPTNNKSCSHKKRLADILTKAISRVMSGTVFSICSISAFSGQPAAAKRCGKECNKEQEKRKLWTLNMHGLVFQPTLNLVSQTAASSPTAPSSSASSRPGILRAPSQQGSNLIAQCDGKPAAGGFNSKCAALSSQMWLTDAKLSERARKLVAVDTNQDQSFPESARTLAAENLDINDEGESKWPHNLRISRADVPHLEKVDSCLRQQLKPAQENKMEDLDVNTLIWGMFLIDTHMQPKISHNGQ